MKKIIKILLVIVWMTLIFSFSNQKADDSSKLSDGLIKKTVCKVNKTDCDVLVKKLVKPVRKCAHFILYLILGFLVLNCFSSFDKKYIIYSILICLLYSISDEIHQLFISGRSGEILDVLIDTLGASLGVKLRKSR